MVGDPGIVVSAARWLLVVAFALGGVSKVAAPDSLDRSLDVLGWFSAPGVRRLAVGALALTEVAAAALAGMRPYVLSTGIFLTGLTAFLLVVMVRITSLDPAGDCGCFSPTLLSKARVKVRGSIAVVRNILLLSAAVLLLSMQQAW
jgi:hypothetical protein